MQRRGIEVQLIAGQVVERPVEDTDDLCGFIVDDALFLLVPQHGYRDSTTVVRVITGVTLMEKVQVIDLVAAGAFALVEGPAVFAHQPADHRHVDQVFQALELAKDQGAVGPGAGQGYIQVIASCFSGWQLIVTLRAFALEGAVFAAFIPLVMPASVDQQAHAELLGDSFEYRAQCTSLSSNE
ncbi:hypothetical protein D3C79_655280 [compost metagenome]